MKKSFNLLLLCLFLSINIETGKVSAQNLLSNGDACTDNAQCDSGFCGTNSYLNTNECQPYNPSTPVQDSSTMSFKDTLKSLSGTFNDVKSTVNNVSGTINDVKGVVNTVTGAVNEIQGAAASITSGVDNNPTSANTALNNSQTFSSSKNYILLEPSVSGIPSGNLLTSNNGKSVAIGNNIGDVIAFIEIILVGICLAASVIVIMIGSFKRMTTDSVYNKTEGADMIGHGIFGLLIALSFYLMLLIINPDMLRKGIDLASYKITSVIDYKPAGQTASQDPAINPASNTPRPYSPIPVTTDAINRKLLSDAGIDTNHPGADCTADQWKEAVPKCTSLEGLPRETVNMLISLISDCGGKDRCSVVVTGGTEPGHKTHGKGLYPVDLNCSNNGASCSKSETKLNTFITKKLPDAKLVNSFCYNLYGPYQGRFFFCDENISKTGSGAPHWHVIGPN